MPAIKLEKFSYPVLAGAAAKVVTTEELEALRQEAFEDGVREGASAASEAFTTAQSQTLAKIHEIIGDAFFSREEARQLALRSLRPLVESIAQALAPELSRSGLGAEIAALVEQATREAPPDRLDIRIAPEMAQDLGSAFSNTSGVSVTGDDTLSDGQVIVEWSGGFDRIDLAQNQDKVLSAIQSYFDALDRTLENGAKHAN